MEEYLKAIKEKVCSICVDSNENGQCKMTDEEFCAVELNINKIVAAVNSVESDRIEDYYEALHDYVCISCKNETDDGYCKLRNDVNCALDRYFPHIVETIRSVRLTP
jgi:hypothetical protein